jgi:phosphoglycolate phosphatase-like HAD superfamily hydrolase
MAGDNMRDVKAGINAGCIPVFLTDTPEKKADFLQFPKLADFAEFLLASGKNQS